MILIINWFKFYCVEVLVKFGCIEKLVNDNIFNNMFIII